MPSWEFVKLGPRVQRREAFEDKFFVGQGESEEDGYSDAEHLVRETVQNALDAKHDNASVVMRFAVYAPQTADRADQLRRAYFDARFQEHSAAARKGDAFAGTAKDRPMRWLVVEDFATHGLRGDTDQTLDSLAGEVGHEWYWYFFRVGQSGKTGQNLGRWGLGKTVLARQSKVNATLTLTVRADDRRKLLMGLVVQPTHEIAGAVYAPDAFWCDGFFKGGRPAPVADPRQIAAFERLFGTQRADLPGTSVVVPYCHEILSGGDVLRAAIVNFFVRVVRHSDLEALVRFEDGRRQTLDRTTIHAAGAAMKWSGKSNKAGEPPPLDLAQAIEATEHDVLLSKRNVAAADAFEPAALARSRERFRAGQAVRARLPIDVQARGGAVEHSSFDVLLRISEDRRRAGKPGRTYFVREGMTLTGENAAASVKGLEALVLLDERAVCAFVGDAEDPSHQHFDQRDKIKAKYVHGSLSRLDAIRKCVEPLSRALAPPAEGVRKDLLNSFFARPQPAAPARRRAATRAGAGGASASEGDEDRGEITPTPRWWAVGRIDSGFRVYRDRRRPVPAGARLRVTCAYELAGGDPIHNWSPIDFDFHSRAWTAPSAAGANVRPADRGNELLVEPLADEFDVKVQGFYLKLELLVRVDDVSSAPAAPVGDERKADELTGEPAVPA